MAHAALVLASSSPRRLALLRQVGIEPDRVDPPAVDETPRARELPLPCALRLAETKVRAAHAAHPDAFVLAADTVVACGRRILDQTADPERARAMLALLSGRRHRVYTAVAVMTPDARRSVKSAMTHVRFKRLSRDEIEAYIEAGEWRGKAGAYAIQGRGAAFVPAINGSYSNVVGLPLVLTLAMLGGLGWRGG